MKRYNIFVIARLYFRRYFEFLIKNTNINKQGDAINLFIYSLKRLYGVDAVEYSEAIAKYGDSCIKYLGSTPKTPKVPLRVMFEDKIRIISICEGYAKISGLLSARSIKCGREGGSWLNTSQVEEEGNNYENGL